VAVSSLTAKTSKTSRHKREEWLRLPLPSLALLSERHLFHSHAPIYALIPSVCGPQLICITAYIRMTMMLIKCYRYNQHICSIKLYAHTICWNHVYAMFALALKQFFAGLLYLTQALLTSLCQLSQQLQLLLFLLPMLTNYDCLANTNKSINCRYFLQPARTLHRFDSCKLLFLLHKRNAMQWNAIQNIKRKKKINNRRKRSRSHCKCSKLTIMQFITQCARMYAMISFTSANWHFNYGSSK